MSAAEKTTGEQGEFLILPDGRVLAHNLTPALARVLARLNPGDEQMRTRAGARAAGEAKDG